MCKIKSAIAEVCAQHPQWWVAVNSDESTPLPYVFNDPPEGSPDGRSQLTFSGYAEGHSRKASWDPDGEKRRIIIEYVDRKTGIRGIMGGRASIDFARSDKRVGMNRLERYLFRAGHAPEVLKDPIYLGDAFGEGGNDQPMLGGLPSGRGAPTTAGYRCRVVYHDTETLRWLQEVLRGIRERQSRPPGAFGAVRQACTMPPTCGIMGHAL